MNKPLLIATLLLFVTGRPAWAKEEKKILPPKQIVTDGKVFKYNPAWKDKETYLEVNCDDDAEQEIVISFLGTYKPPSEESRLDKNETFLPPGQELIILENYAFYQIYDKDAGGHYQLLKTIHAMDQLGEVKVLRLENTKTIALAFLSPGGENYTDLSIYQWQEGGYRLLLNDGGSLGIELDLAGHPATIRILRKQGADVFVWDPEKKSFVLSGYRTPKDSY
ncbi:MAG: hypothetical protein V1863_05130 [Candidatus Omnitrophota bacterium]